MKMRMTFLLALIVGAAFFSPSWAGTFSPGLRSISLVAETNTQCLTCEPDPQRAEQNRSASNLMPLDVGVTIGGAAASHVSEILHTDGYTYGMAFTLVADGPQESSEFGYNRGEASLEFPFSVDRRVVFGLSREVTIDEPAPLDYERVFQTLLGESQVGSAIVTGSSNSMSWTVLHPGDYTLTVDVNSTGSSIEYSRTEAAYAMSFFAFEQPVGDLDGDGLFSARDIDMLSMVARRLRNGVQISSSLLNIAGNDFLNDEDRDYWVHELAGTTYGDANLDQHFGTEDLVAVFKAGEYEDGLLHNSTWATGDWTGDREFDSSDLVKALEDGGFSNTSSPQAVGAAVAVPEPSPSLLRALILIVACGAGRRRHRAVSNTVSTRLSRTI